MQSGLVSLSQNNMHLVLSTEDNAFDNKNSDCDMLLNISAVSKNIEASFRPAHILTFDG